VSTRDERLGFEELTDLVEATRRSTSPGLRQVGEREVCLRVKATDEAWVRQLYQEHGKAMLAYSARLTGDRSAAEDVVQEALVRAWRHLDHPDDGKNSVRAWLFTVIRHLVIDRARTRNSRPLEVVETPRAHPIERDHADRVVDSMLAFRALDSLSPEHRAVLESVYLRGNTVRETAAKLGIPPGTVKSRTYYALRCLRQLLRNPDRVEDPAALAG
jgi:RNA polymerase sigma-70 factor (ECF subfamily)